jgi:GNAT superfamily N-acetyltransferase
MSNVWYLRESRIGDDLWKVTAFVSDAHPDGAVVTGGVLDEAPVLWRSHESERGMVRIDVDPAGAPGAPPLWFVIVDEPRASPRATNLVAFGTDHFARGTVVSKYVFATLGLHSDAQAGAIRWFPDDAVVHQVFVSPDWRRRHVGSQILHVADAFHQASGWPGHLTGDGRRTELGKQFLAAQRHPARFAPVTETMRPMDPPTGVSER